MNQSDEFTPEQIAHLAEYYHQRECHMDHNGQCGWYYENGASHPPTSPRWSHEHWERRVPHLVARDRRNVAEIELILNGGDQIGDLS